MDNAMLVKGEFVLKLSKKDISSIDELINKIKSTTDLDDSCFCKEISRLAYNPLLKIDDETERNKMVDSIFEKVKVSKAEDKSIEVLLLKINLLCVKNNDLNKIISMYEKEKENFKEKNNKLTINYNLVSLYINVGDFEKLEKAVNEIKELERQ